MSQTSIGKVVRFFSWLDGAFKRCSSLIMFLVAAAFLAWPAQINFKALEARGPAKGVILDPIEKRDFGVEFSELINPIQEKAKKLGDDYGPTQYYEDMKVIETWVHQNPLYDGEFVESVKSSLHQMMTQYGGVAYWSDEKKEELARADREYYQWKDKTFPQEKINPITSEKFWAWALSALHWFFVFWLRSLLIIPLFYLNRMAGRSGILRTFLENKWRFVLAIIAWPVMIFYYPSNVVREIIVEAELRRLKNPFRRLTLREKKIIREVAGDGRRFKNWRADFRLRNRDKFQRSFVTALLVTIVLILFTPVARSAPVETHCYVSSTMICANAPPGSIMTVQTDQSDQQDSASVAVLLQPILLVIPLALSFVIETVREKLIVGPVRDLIPIPKISPVFTT